MTDRRHTSLLAPYRIPPPDPLVEQLSLYLLAALRYAPIDESSDVRAPALDAQLAGMGPGQLELFNAFLRNQFFESIYVDRPERSEITAALEASGTLVVHGPRGAGKSTVLARIARDFERLTPPPKILVTVDLARREPGELRHRSFEGLCKVILNRILGAVSKQCETIDQDELSEAMYARDPSFEGVAKLTRPGIDPSQSVWENAVLSYLAESAPADRLTYIARAVVRSLHRPLLLIVDNADALEPSVQGRLVDTFLAANQSLGYGPLTAVIAVRNENYGNLSPHAAGSFFFVEKRMQPSRGMAQRYMLGVSDVFYQNATATDELTGRAERPRDRPDDEGHGTDASVPDREWQPERPPKVYRPGDFLWSVVESRLVALADFAQSDRCDLTSLQSVGSGELGDPGEVLRSIIDVSLAFVQSMRSSLRDQYFFDWHNGSIRSACASLYNFAYHHFTNRDHTTDVGDLVEWARQPGSTVERHVAIDSILRYWAFRRVPDGRCELRIPNIFGLHDAVRKNGLRFPALKVLDRLAWIDRIGAHETVGSLREAFDHWGLPSPKVDEILMQLAAKRKNDQFGFISFDRRAVNSFDEDEIVLVDHRKVNFLASAATLRRGIIDRVETIFWMALFNPLVDRSRIMDRLPENKKLIDRDAILNRQFRCQVAIDFLSLVVAPASVGEWNRIDRSAIGEFREDFGLTSIESLYIVAVIEPFERYVRLSFPSVKDSRRKDMLETLHRLERFARDWWDDVQ